MNVRILRVVLGRFLCTCGVYSNLSMFGRNHLILGKLGKKVEEENSFESSMKKIGRHAQHAPEILGRRTNIEQKLSF